MKFSLGYPLAHHPTDDAFTTPEFLAEFARVAEECGYHSVNVTEHPIPGTSGSAPAATMRSTRSWRLAFAAGGHRADPALTNLTVVPYRNPFLLAKAVASLDRVANGRVTLGVGTGYLKPEFFAARRRLRGAQRPVRRVDRGVPARVDRARAVAYEGRHFSARDNSAHPTPVQDPLPIWIGGNAAHSPAGRDVGAGLDADAEPARIRVDPPQRRARDPRRPGDDARRPPPRAERGGPHRPLDVMFMASTRRCPATTTGTPGVIATTSAPRPTSG